MYDLGEFEQKGSVRTKYGTRQQYRSAIRALQKAGLQVYADVVLNHRMGGDSTETARAVPYPQDDRRRPKGEPRDIRAYTHYHFPGRKQKHSSFEWHSHHFDAVDYDDLHPDERNTVYLFEGKTFDDEVALERGNYSYLMGSDLDFQNEEVRAEVTRWGKWYLDQTGVDGFRLDAVKHISAWFFPQWLDEMEKHAGKDLFVDAVARVDGGRVVQAPRLRDHPAASGRLSLCLLPRLLRGHLRRPGGKSRDALAPVAYRQVPSRPPRLRLGSPVRLLRPLEPRGLDASRGRSAPQGDGGAPQRRAGGDEVDGSR
jgi:hypothetical protein